MTLDVVIRPVKQADFNSIVPWIRKETWPANADILAIYQAQDPGGFLVAEHKQHGVIGCVTFIQLDDSTTMIGLFIVSEEHRGEGVGRLLWNEGYRRNADRALCLVASPHMASNYRSKGFTQIGTNVEEYLGFPDITKLPDVLTNEQHSYKEYSPEYFDKLLDYDTSVHIIQRKMFLEMYVNLKNSKTVVCICNDGEVLGYACLVQLDTNAYLLGPVLCETDNIACNLAIHVLKYLPKGASLAVYIEDSKTKFKDLMTQIGLERGKVYPRMETSTFMIQNPMHKMYASSTMSTVII